MIRNHWRGNGLRKVNHFHMHSNSKTYVLQWRKALFCPAQSLCAFRTISSHDVTCISLEYRMLDKKKKKKRTIMCDFHLGNEVYFHRFTVSTPTNSDRFILALRNLKVLARTGSHACYLHLNLVWLDQFLRHILVIRPLPLIVMLRL